MGSPWVYSIDKLKYIGRPLDRDLRFVLVTMENHIYPKDSVWILAYHKDSDPFEYSYRENIWTNNVCSHVIFNKYYTEDV